MNITKYLMLIILQIKMVLNKQNLTLENYLIQNWRVNYDKRRISNIA